MRHVLALTLLLALPSRATDIVLPVVELPDGGFAVVCPQAGADNGGCVSAGDQMIGGLKRFQGAISASSATDWNGAAAYLFGNLWLDGIVRAYPEGASVILQGRRNGSDTVADVVIESGYYRDAGHILSIRNGTPLPVFGVTHFGEVLLSGPAPYAGATSGFAQIVDNTGSAGHIFARSMPGQGLVMAGGFGAPGTDSTILADGGSISFAGLHGELTVSSLHPRTGGLMFDFRNLRSGTGAITDMVAFIDYNGGFGQRHGLTRAQFGKCPASLVMTSHGQMYDGQLTSVRMWATDEEYWYTCKSCGWVRDP